MSFSGHHAKVASDQLQKTWQAMADAADALAAGMGDIDLREDDAMSITSAGLTPAEQAAEVFEIHSSASSMERDELQKKLVESEIKNRALERQIKSQKATAQKNNAQARAAAATYGPIHNRVLATTDDYTGVEGPIMRMNHFEVWWMQKWLETRAAQIRAMDDVDALFRLHDLVKTENEDATLADRHHEIEKAWRNYKEWVKKNNKMQEAGLTDAPATPVQGAAAATTPGSGGRTRRTTPLR